jgi:hypothetical protein
VIDEQKQGERLFARSARGDGSGIISMPVDMQEAAREVVLKHWTDWALEYLWQCGHHRDELTHVADSLHDVLGQWWDARNSFDKPDDPPQFFPEGKDWNVFWNPSDVPIKYKHEDGEEDDDDDDEEEREEREFWYSLGWDGCLRTLEKKRKLKRPNLCERIASLVRGLKW